MFLYSDLCSRREERAWADGRRTVPTAKPAPSPTTCWLGADRLVDPGLDRGRGAVPADELELDRRSRSCSSSAAMVERFVGPRTGVTLRLGVRFRGFDRFRWLELGRSDGVSASGGMWDVRVRLVMEEMDADLDRALRMGEEKDEALMRRRGLSPPTDVEGGGDRRTLEPGW